MNLAVTVSLEAVHTLCSFEKNKHIPIYFIKVVCKRWIKVWLFCCVF